MVGAEGFELSTSSSQSWRSTRLSYTPAGPRSCHVTERGATALTGKDAVMDANTRANAQLFRPPCANLQHATRHSDGRHRRIRIRGRVVGDIQNAPV